MAIGTEGKLFFYENLCFDVHCGGFLYYLCRPKVFTLVVPFSIHIT